MNLFDQILNDVVTPYLEPRIKKSSIQAVKAYVKSIETARGVAKKSYELSVIAAVAVTGIVLMIVAIVGLLPVDPRAALFSLLAVGAVITAIAVGLTRASLNEKSWLEKSRSNELMEAVLKPWPTAYSVPDPRDIFRGSPEASQAVEAAQNFDANRALEISEANQIARSATHEPINTRVPGGVYSSMTTPDGSIATRSIDTTADLRR